MSYEINQTHDAAVKSWIESANQPGSDFPIQNLPFGVFRERSDSDDPLEIETDARIGIAIGDMVLDVASCDEAGLFDNEAAEAAGVCQLEWLNPLMSLGPVHWSALRQRVFELLREGSREREKVEPHLVPIDQVEMLLPAVIGDYTDFYASAFHATNVGSMFRPDNPLLPNYKWVPIGYHGRASSIVPSGTPVRRPMGQTRDGEAPPVFGPSKRLDYELEVGFYVGQGNELGQPIPLEQAWENIFGLSLVNDWSARDVQTWEYQPLGPFLAKNFATTVSPWVVTMEALAPFRVPALARGEGDPQPLPYLASESEKRSGGIDITLEVLLSTAKMRETGAEPVRISRGSFRNMYWTIAQMLTHHASNGCNLRPGDLLASGTVSGPEKDSRGCLLELTWRGTEPLQLPSGETRKFLEDGDEVILRGWCERKGFARIGFGECRGVVLPA